MGDIMMRAPVSACSALMISPPLPSTFPADAAGITKIALDERAAPAAKRVRAIHIRCAFCEGRSIAGFVLLISVLI